MQIFVQAFELPSVMGPLVLDVDQGTGIFVKQ